MHYNSLIIKYKSYLGECYELYNIGIIDNFDKEFDYSYSDLDLEYEDIIKKHNCISVNEDFF